MEYDVWDGVVPRELRIGLDATVLVDQTHDPNEVPEQILVKLQTVLQLEVQGLSSAVEQKPPSKKDKLEAQAKRKYLRCRFMLPSALQERCS